MVFSHIWSDGPIPCGRAGCGNLVVDRRQAIFLVSDGATIPFCCQVCFAEACRRQMQQHQSIAAKDPLERLGYMPQDTR